MLDHLQLIPNAECVSYTLKPIGDDMQALGNGALKNVKNFYRLESVDNAKISIRVHCMGKNQKTFGYIVHYK